MKRVQPAAPLAGTQRADQSPAGPFLGGKFGRGGGAT